MHVNFMLDFFIDDHPKLMDKGFCQDTIQVFRFDKKNRFGKMVFVVECDVHWIFRSNVFCSISTLSQKVCSRIENTVSRMKEQGNAGESEKRESYVLMSKSLRKMTVFYIISVVVVC